jgi:hypothetical protein
MPEYYVSKFRFARDFELARVAAERLPASICKRLPIWGPWMYAAISMFDSDSNSASIEDFKVAFAARMYPAQNLNSLGEMIGRDRDYFVQESIFIRHLDAKDEVSSRVHYGIPTNEEMRKISQYAMNS